MVSKYFPLKVQIVNILGFPGHKVSVATIQLCHGSTKSGMKNTETNGLGCVPIKLYSHKSDDRVNWPMGHSFLTLAKRSTAIVRKRRESVASLADIGELE